MKSDPGRRPTDILRSHNLHAKKEWGQNFLGDESVLEDLARLAGAQKGDTIVEFGAGLGHYTRALAATGAHVIAVERDRELVPILRDELEGLDVRIEEANAKTFDLGPIFIGAGKKLILCGNLPYHLSSPILFHLLDQRAYLKRAVFLLQREVAVRIAAPPDSEDYGLLSVLLGLWADARVGLHVNRNAFHPPPAVESAALVLDLLEAPRAPVLDEGRFRAIVKAAFAQRRKTLGNALKAVPGAAEAAAKAGIDTRRRGETLSCQEFASIEVAMGPVQPGAPAPAADRDRGRDRDGDQDGDLDE